MHRALHCTYSMRNKFPPTSFPYFSFTSTWIGLQLDHWFFGGIIFPNNISLHDVGFSVCFILLYAQSAAYYASESFLPPPSFSSLFIFLCFTTLSLHVLIPPSQNLRISEENLTIGSSDVAQSSLHLSHLILCSCSWLGMWCGWLLNQFLSIVCALPSLSTWFIGYWCVVYFQKPKNDFILSPSLLTWLSCHCWDARDLVPNCLVGHQVIGLALLSLISNSKV